MKTYVLKHLGINWGGGVGQLLQSNSETSHSPSCSHTYFPAETNSVITQICSCLCMWIGFHTFFQQFLKH